MSSRTFISAVTHSGVAVTNLIPSSFAKGSMSRLSCSIASMRSIMRSLVECEWTIDGSTLGNNQGSTFAVDASVVRSISGGARMFLKLDADGALYDQVYRALRGQILGGRLAACSPRASHPRPRARARCLAQRRDHGVSAIARRRLPDGAQGLWHFCRARTAAPSDDCRRSTPSYCRAHCRARPSVGIRAPSARGLAWRAVHMGAAARRAAIRFPLRSAVVYRFSARNMVPRSGPPRSPRYDSRSRLRFAGGIVRVARGDRRIRRPCPRDCLYA